MVIFDNNPRVFMARETIDVRKGIDYLASLVQSSFDLNPADKSLYIFSNRRHNRIKCLYFDGTGYWVLTKRIDHGTLKWKLSVDDPCPEITEKQLRWLLDGLKPEQRTAFPIIEYGQAGRQA